MNQLHSLTGETQPKTEIVPKKPKPDVPIVDKPPEVSEDVISLRNQVTDLESHKKALEGRVSELENELKGHRQMIDRDTILMKFIPLKSDDDYRSVVDKLVARMGTDTVTGYVDNMTAPKESIVSSEPRFDLSRFASEETK